MRKLASLLSVIAMCSQCVGDPTPANPPQPTDPPVATTLPPTTEVPTTMPPAPTDNRWVMGFYPSYQRGQVPAASFPYDKTTHSMIGNVIPTSPSECCVPPEWEPNIAEFEQFLGDAVTGAHLAGVKAVLMTGGAGGNPNQVWNQATATPESTAIFADSMIAYARRFGFDGIELDWEEEVDVPSEARLAAAIRARWPEAVITVSATGLPVDPATHPEAYIGFAELAASVDRVSPMTYLPIGNWGGWDGPWHQSALYEAADHGLSTGHPASIHRAVTFLLQTGVPASKLGVGIGMFGSAYGDANSDGDCPSAPSNGWNGEWGAWFNDASLPLADIDRWYAPAMTAMWDEAAQVPYLTAAAPGAGGEADGWPPKACYITYENERSAAAKGDYVVANGLGGVIVWTVPQDRRDDGSYPVLDSLNAHLGH